jgi:hypothetical protein
MSTPNTTTSPTIPTSTSTTSVSNPILLVEIVPIEKWTNKILKKDQNIITKYTVEILAQNMTQTRMTDTNNSNDNHTIFKNEGELTEYINKNKTNIYLINKDGITTQDINDEVKKLFVDPTLPEGTLTDMKNNIVYKTLDWRQRIANKISIDPTNELYMKKKEEEAAAAAKKKEEEAAAAAKKKEEEEKKQQQNNSNGVTASPTLFSSIGNKFSNIFPRKGGKRKTMRKQITHKKSSRNKSRSRS